MARFEPELIITQPLLDRLTDQEPAAASDPPASRAQSFRNFKAALRRDLEWLLNTRRIPTPAAPAFQELSRSLYNYGLPDLSSLSAQAAHDIGQLQRHLQETVELFEPRLLNVHVSAEASPGNSRMLRFRIDGLARIDPAPEQISFDTVLELTSGEYQVK